MKRTVLILGAAGRDFHNFNMFFRDNPEYRVAGFTATQIPNIANRRYPAELAGKLYPEGIEYFMVNFRHHQHCCSEIKPVSLTDQLSAPTAWCGILFINAYFIPAFCKVNGSCYTGYPGTNDYSSRRFTHKE